jgi:uncharacterized protein (DUF983 family)
MTSTPNGHASSVPTRFGRALLLHCPRCGSGGIFRSWLKLAERCPRCTLALERGETDFWLGAYAINLVLAEGLAVVIGIVVLRLYWPNTAPGMIVAIVLVIVLPVIFLPFSRTLWLAWDLSFRATEQGD